MLILFFCKKTNTLSAPGGSYQPSFELVHVVRLRNYAQLTLPDKLTKYIPQIASPLERLRTGLGATHWEFLNSKEWRKLIAGDKSIRQAKTLPKIEFKPVGLTDIFFENDQIRVESVRSPAQS